MRFVLTLSLLFTSSCLALASDHVQRNAHAHARHARRAVNSTSPDDESTSDDAIDLAKRGGARFTYFHVGLGACGDYNQDSDYIVALNLPEWDSGSHCGETITISYNGKSTHAIIHDECPSCPPRALDLSPGLFSFFAPLGTGEIYGDWSFGGGGPKPSLAPSPNPPPPTTKKASPTTTTSAADATSSGTISDGAAATTPPSPVAPNVLGQIDSWVTQVAEIIWDGAHVA